MATFTNQATQLPRASDSRRKVVPSCPGGYLKGLGLGLGFQVAALFVHIDAQYVLSPGIGV